MLAQPKPLNGRNRIRVAHVLGKMDRGGVETWLMHVLRNINREKYQLDFVVHTNETGDYDEEIIHLGSKIIPCLSPVQPWKYYKNMKRIFDEHGPYDVVHSHVHYFSGLILKIATSAAIPIRISHSHNDTSSLEEGISVKRRLYTILMKRWIDKYSSIGLAASGNAANALFGRNWKLKPWINIYHCGIDLIPFRQEYDSKEVRNELGIDENAFVIGHIGRFDRQKNHFSLIDIFDNIAKKDHNAVLLLLGTGPLLPQIQKKVEDKKLTNKVLFSGIRKDIPRILMGAIDIFLLPSLFEGLPLVGLEAQAAGKYFIRSKEITDEVDIVKPLVKIISNRRPAEIWANEIIKLRNEKIPINQHEALAIMENTNFNILKGISHLEKCFKGEYGKR